MQDNMQDYWRRRRADIKAIQDSGKIVFIRDHNRLQVIAPKNEVFMVEAKGLAGRYRRKSGLWSFDSRIEKHVRALVEKVWPGQGSNEIVAVIAL